MLTYHFKEWYFQIFILCSNKYIIKVSTSIYDYQIMDYRETRAYILDPCIQEF